MSEWMRRPSAVSPESMNSCRLQSYAEDQRNQTQESPWTLIPDGKEQESIDCDAEDRDPHQCECDPDAPGSEEPAGGRLGHRTISWVGTESIPLPDTFTRIERFRCSEEFDREGRSRLGGSAGGALLNTQTLINSMRANHSRPQEENLPLSRGGSNSREERSAANRHLHGQLPDFSDYEIITKQRFYQAQVAPIGRWIRGTILDVGAHFGRFSVLSPSTISLDLEKRWLLRGTQLGNIRHPVVGSATALPFKSRLFDTVLAIGVVEHIPSQMMSAFLDEIARVATPTGRLVIRASSPYALFAIRRAGMWSDYLHPYSPFRLRAELRRRGWYPIAWLSSGLLGVTRLLAQTIHAPIPWARSYVLVFTRG